MRLPRRKPKYAKHSSRLDRDVDWMRGRHRKSDSAETARWEQEHLIPERPDWMSVETYTALAGLRGSL